MTLETEVAELRAKLAAIEKPEKISAKTLYSRLVARVLREWATYYPMAAWVDPESAVARMSHDLSTLRHKAEQYDCVVRALRVADGGRYRADTIESVIAAARKVVAGAEVTV